MLLKVPSEVLLRLRLPVASSSVTGTGRLPLAVRGPKVCTVTGGSDLELLGALKAQDQGLHIERGHHHGNFRVRPCLATSS